MDDALRAATLDSSSPDVFAQWVALPAADTRTLQEFAEQLGLSCTSSSRGILWWNGHEHVIKHFDEGTE